MSRAGRSQGRQRPLSRSINKQFFSYHANRQAVADTNQPKRRLSLRLQPPKLNKSHLPLVLGAVVGVLCLVYVTTLTTSSRIVVTRATGTPQLRLVQDYRDYVNSQLRGSLMNRNKLTINPTKLQDKLLAQFPEIDSATVVLPLMGHKPIIEIVPTNPALMIVNSQGGWLINSHGKVVLDVRDLPKGTGVDVPTVKEEAGLVIELGKGALSTQDVKFITTVVKQLSARKQEVASLTLPPLASELHAKVKGQPYIIKFSLLTDPRLAVGQYMAMLDQLHHDQIVPKEYIDVRVEERVYIK